MNLEASQLAMLVRMAGLDPPPFFMGAFAQDALLAGMVTRPHKDFDWLLPRSELELRFGRAESATSAAALGCQQGCGATGQERIKPVPWPAMRKEPASDPDGALVCVVEIPKGARNKYEYDPELGGIKFDRLLMSAATYPTDYGYLRDTLAEDGDPLDALVCLYEPTFAGCLIPVKPVGMFKMQDEKGVDDKIICVPLHDPYWNRYEELEDLPPLLRQEIEQFFSIYKDLEKDKSVSIGGWSSRAEAAAEIAAARRRAREP